MFFLVIILNFLFLVCWIYFVVKCVFLLLFLILIIFGYWERWMIKEIFRLYLIFLGLLYSKIGRWGIVFVIVIMCWYNLLFVGEMNIGGKIDKLLVLFFFVVFVINIFFFVVIDLIFI